MSLLVNTGPMSQVKRKRERKERCTALELVRGTLTANMKIMWLCQTRSSLFIWDMFLIFPQTNEVRGWNVVHQIRENVNRVINVTPSLLVLAFTCQWISNVSFNSGQTLWTHLQRQCYLDAASVFGINCSNPWCGYCGWNVLCATHDTIKEFCFSCQIGIFS